MENVLKLLHENMIFFIPLGFANIVPALIITRHISLTRSKRVADALGPRCTKHSLYRRCSGLVEHGAVFFEKHLNKGSIYKRAKQKLQKAGYKGEHAAILYLGVKYILLPFTFILSLVLNYPDIMPSIAATVLIYTVAEGIISSGKRKLNLRFQKYIYKLYKYLHNQVEAGVKPTEAIRSAYEIVEDKELRAILVRLAARYELTLDIDSALEEFRSNFDAHEAETFCVALKQGIDTGDNKELLSKQEDVMFKKYFNYVQAETDSCKSRSVAAATVFVSIVGVMIIVPLLREVGQAAGRIFIN
jgi:hypothetical protein